MFNSSYNLGFLGVTSPILELELEDRLVKAIIYLTKYKLFENRLPLIEKINFILTIFLYYHAKKTGQYEPAGFFINKDF